MSTRYDKKDTHTHFSMYVHNEFIVNTIHVITTQLGVVGFAHGMWDKLH